MEEKILSLQQRKRAVIHATLGSEEQLSEALTWEEIQELLASGTTVASRRHGRSRV